MGFGFLVFNMVLTLFFKLLACQEPNTDGYFVSEFFKRMRMDSSSSPFHNFSAPVCSWQGVFCDAEEAYVEGLMASGLGLSGAIPDVTIGKLSRLQSLDLSSNEITALPTDMWSLGSLKSLNLSNNQISGFLPNNIDNFGVLETLDLSRNSFSGEIPPALGSLLSLRVLKLNGNQFEGRVPVGILSCISLVVMDFSMNKLNGSLPDGFGAAFSKLQSLDLAGNGIEGREPDFTQLHSLISLNISGNLFQGSVIGLFMEQLQVMDLSRNKFEGLISQVQFNSSSSLVHLDLSENQFSGEMLEGFSHVQNLKHLNLAFNRFSRNSFPESYKLWGLRLELEYLNMSNTNLIGQIPPEISKLSNLHTLDLSQNHLTGHIPYSLTMKSLQVLDVSQNNMTGQIPYSVLQKLPWMESFNFSYNNFTFCGSEISPQTFETRFVGSSSNCPIAANPALFQRKPTDDNKGLKLALALTISMVVLLFGILCFAFGCRRKSTMWPVKQHKEEEQQNNISGPFSFRTDSTTWVADVKQANSVGVIIFEKPLLNITFADLLTATSNFDRGTTLLSEGKFGPVYSGFLPGGIHVAVKVLVHGSTLTEHEAARELEFLGRIKHPNLVPLTGYCLAGDQRIALYDYMENGNLQNLLHGRGSEDSEGLPITSWEFRHKIALGTARALAFLHHGCSPPIIHRDVKASSVYLDSNLDPKLSDFGLAKLFGNGLDQIEIGGDDDDDLRHAATTKSDVYWYGVILFELISGRNPAEDENLVSWVRELVRTNQSSRAIDSRILGTGFDVCNMEEVLKIGYLCTADLPAKRPSMQQVVGLLKDIEPRRDNSNVLVVSRSS